MGTAAQSLDRFAATRDHPAIAYSDPERHDAVADLNRRLRTGKAHLRFEPTSGYLTSVLAALAVPIESQSLVFSQGSAQGSLIGPSNPRAIFFSDDVAVGWVRGADEIELAAQDPRQGVTFYTLAQRQSVLPVVSRRDDCLRCHLVAETLGVPGLLTFSTFRMSDSPTAYALGLPVDHRTPISERWGGWYVTGRVDAPHKGNVPVVVPERDLHRPQQAPPVLDDVSGTLDTRGFPSACSDVDAQLVLAHQTRMMDLITRLGWETRVALHDRARGAPPPAGVDTTPLPAGVRDMVGDLVDYLLFVDEAPLPPGVSGSCAAFARRFEAAGRRDHLNRSLRDLDLSTRLMRYPCSYMIDAPAFAALPREARDAVYRRLWDVLSGRDRAPRFAHLTLPVRKQIVEILTDTHQDLPSDFGGPVR